MAHDAMALVFAQVVALRESASSVLRQADALLLTLENVTTVPPATADEAAAMSSAAVGSRARRDPRATFDDLPAPVPAARFAPDASGDLARSPSPSQ
jgi:hypothetical protein